MRVVIVGAGVVGAGLAEQLIEQAHDVTIVEKDGEIIPRLQNRLDCLIIHGAGNNADILEQANVAEADFLICMTSSDELNLLICGMVKRTAGKPQKIARVRNIKHSTTQSYVESFNIDNIIIPETIALQAIMNSINTGALGNTLEFKDSNLQLRSIAVEPHSIFCNKTVGEAFVAADTQFLIALIIRDNQQIIPNGNSVIMADDVIYIAAEAEQFDRIYTLAGSVPSPIKNVVLYGTNEIGKLVCEQLLAKRREVPRAHRSVLRSYRVKLAVIEDDLHIAQEWARLFPKALIINGEIADHRLLVEENLQYADLCISVSNNDESNLLSATYLKLIGIKRAIVLVTRPGYPVLGSKLGIDATISLKNEVINEILKHINRKNINSLHTILDHQIDVVEYVVSSHSRACNQKIKDVGLPDESLVLSITRTITRQKHTFIPRGDFVLHANDHVALIARADVGEKIHKLLTE